MSPTAFVLSSRPLLGCSMLNAASSSSSSSSNVGPYEQCGGKNYDGPTSCVEAYQCYVWFDEWYSQCRPIQNYATPVEMGIYRQCGGKEYTGSTSCAAGLNCLVHNDWYSQCQPYEDFAEATWTQTGDLDDWTPGSQGFGCALSYDGRALVTNAWQNINSAGYLAGATRIYNQNIGSQKWVQIGQKILGSGLLSLQGWPSISGDGKSIAVGEGYGDGGNGAQSGLIKVFTFFERINEWVQVGNNIAGEAAGNQLWWSALNFDGSILAAGALLADNSGTDSGNLRLFQLNPTTDDWVQLGRTLTGNAGQQVGFPQISMTGKVVALGSFLRDEENQFNGIGGVQVYHWYADDTGAENWQEKGQFLATIGPDGYPSLSADGKTVAVGSRWADAENITDRGQVQVYRFDDVANLWVQYGQTVYGEEANDAAGNVRLSGDGKRFILGGKNNDGPIGGTNHGHMRVFEINRDGTLWEMLGQEIFGENEGDELDYPSINYDGTVIAAGAAFHENTGHVRTFRLDQFPRNT